MSPTQIAVRIETSDTDPIDAPGDGLVFDAAATAWMAKGLCRSLPPAVFFPSDGVGVERARKICAQCPMQAVCLDYALDNRIDHGVWGGASERERRRILKRRRAEARAAATGVAAGVAA